MADERPRERADAARNRRAILEATAALLAEHGADALTMDRVAAAAGVGKGTIFHRFGNRAGLLHEMIAETTFALMDAVRTGPPPLGPGAPADARLLAFFDAFVRMMTDNIEVTVAYLQGPPHPQAAEIHEFWDEHIAALLREARPDLDAEVVGRLLFGALGAAMVPQMARAGETERLLGAVRELVESVLLIR